MYRGVASGPPSDQDTSPLEYLPLSSPPLLDYPEWTQSLSLWQAPDHIKGPITTRTSTITLCACPSDGPASSLRYPPHLILLHTALKLSLGELG